MKKAVIVLSGGIDSVCMGAILKSKYDLYGITFSYGQRANQEIKSAKKIGKTLKLKEHKILNINFIVREIIIFNFLKSSMKFSLKVLSASGIVRKWVFNAIFSPSGFPSTFHSSSVLTSSNIDLGFFFYVIFNLFA